VVQALIVILERESALSLALLTITRVHDIAA
jgi:hypothetical protein